MIGYKFVCLILIGVVFSHCTYNVEEELYPSVECDTIDMSYISDIVPILSLDCYQCHNADANFGNVTLDSYADVIIYIENETLLGSINHQDGFSAMPQGAPKLLDCEIEKIESWVLAGAPNN